MTDADKIIMAQEDLDLAAIPGLHFEDCTQQQAVRITRRHSPGAFRSGKRAHRKDGMTALAAVELFVFAVAFAVSGAVGWFPPAFAAIMSSLNAGVGMLLAFLAGSGK